MSQRKTGAGLRAKRAVDNHATGSSQMTGDLRELSRRFNSAPRISALSRPNLGFVPPGHKSSHKSERQALNARVS
jgi:hypothetical protein